MEIMYNKLVEKKNSIAVIGLGYVGIYSVPRLHQGEMRTGA